MKHIGPREIVLLFTIAALILGKWRLPRLRDGDEGSQLLRELKQMPVFSAETIHGKEAEFIRDRLPKRFPFALILAAALIFGAVAWWLNT
ncbi:MAG TPA: hypothetical protein VFJ95_06710 [Gammaproteobacteria bacterium]|jgi:hypothetical protein|nr:hypothetical protein [Gammaproteobacteria bacterium]